MVGPVSPSSVFTFPFETSVVIASIHFEIIVLLSPLLASASVRSVPGLVVSVAIVYN